MARTLSALAAIAVLGVSLPALGAVPPQGDPVADRSMSHPDLFIQSVHLPLDLLPPIQAAKLKLDLSALGIRGDLAGYDQRSGRWGSLVAKSPLVPGPGAGNSLTWLALGIAAPNTDAAYRAAVWSAFRSFLAANRSLLGVEGGELDAPSIGTYEKNRLVHIYAGRVYGGVPVRDSYVKATLNSGNLVLYTTRNWGTISLSTSPAVSAAAARNVVAAHLSGLDASWGAAQLVIVPLASGDGLDYRLAWSQPAQVSGSHGSWEALVDAKTGELLAFQDRNSYLDQKKIVGGVYPVSNDGRATNGVPDGVEQPGYPMGRAYVFAPGQLTANSEGLVTVPGGASYRTELRGPYVRIQDGCGGVSESTSCDTLDLGTGAGTDCARESGHSFGDTHSARTGFHELNRLIDQAKSWIGPTASNTLPTAGWLNMQIPANMNVNNACNAFFSPADTAAVTTGSINFYRFGKLGSNVCRNTGEIAAVFDHEWGHGLDTFDDSKGVSMPGEAYADMTAVLRLNQSCIGRGFFFDNTFGGLFHGNGDLATECSGVRELDFTKRLSGMPHDLAWVLDQNPTVPGNCGAIVNNPTTGTPAPTPFNAGPCGRNTHCEGSIIGEAFWDLLKRDLPCHGRGWELASGGAVAGGRCKGGAPTMDENTALVLVTRLFYVGGPGVKLGYQCDVRVGGCNADSWYLNMLAADDDDGAIENGTPHMAAIADAFRRHGIACRVPLVSNAGCSASPAPSARPVVTATAGNRSATITWTAVPDAIEYWVLRTDGVHGCDFGKTRMARIAASAPRTFTQTDLLDGHAYFYSVVPVGGVAVAGLVADACAGPVSDCASVVPLAPGEAPAECVAPPNRPPTAVDDAVAVPKNHANTLDVVGNDSDPDLDDVALVSVTAPQHGTAVIAADGRVTYTPVAGYSGSDAFTYTIADPHGATGTGAVTLAVAGDPCADGFSVLSDPAGDATGARSEYDLTGASITQLSGGNVMFTLKVSGFPAAGTPPPDSTWPISFTAADGSIRFVKMATAPALPVFRYGNGDPSAAGTDAPGSSVAADGTIRIVVPAAAVGNPQPGDDLKFFLTRIRIDGGAVYLIPDSMPNSLVPSGRFEFVTCNQ